MHDETIFPDSYKFDPTRFLDEEGNLAVCGSDIGNILPSLCDSAITASQ
jgi:cytochrome P450